MVQGDGSTFSRRTLIRAAAVGAGILLVQPTGILLAGRATAAELPTMTSPKNIEIHADAIDQYLGMVSRRGSTDLEGIRAEYREAIAVFPFVLPAAWAFPAESSLTDATPGMDWERGNGAVEAYSFWSRAVATRAYEAHVAGDDSTADGFLDVLEAAHGSSIRRAFWDDPNDSFITDVVTPARSRNGVRTGGEGDFTALKLAIIG